MSSVSTCKWCGLRVPRAALRVHAETVCCGEGSPASAKKWTGNALAPGSVHIRTIIPQSFQVPSHQLPLTHDENGATTKEAQLPSPDLAELMHVIPRLQQESANLTEAGCIVESAEAQDGSLAHDVNMLVCHWFVHNAARLFTFAHCWVSAASITAVICVMTYVRGCVESSEQCFISRFSMFSSAQTCQTVAWMISSKSFIPSSMIPKLDQRRSRLGPATEYLNHVCNCWPCCYHVLSSGLQSLAIKNVSPGVSCVSASTAPHPELS
jgi:hypothetical protein